MGYYPCVTGVLTRGHDLVREQCQVGSLTGAVASQRVTEAPKGSLRMVGNHSKSNIEVKFGDLKVTAQDGEVVVTITGH